MNKVDVKRLTKYADDLALWSTEQAALLRAGRLDRIDVANLAEEIEDLAARVRSEIRSRLRILLVHLLKHQFQPAKVSPSWLATIKVQRLELMDILDENPSLRPYPGEALVKVYRSARAGAAGQTKLPESTFPTSCPYTIDQVLDPAFLPGGE